MAASNPFGEDEDDIDVRSLLQQHIDVITIYRFKVKYIFSYQFVHISGRFTFTKSLLIGRTQ